MNKNDRLTMADAAKYAGVSLRTIYYAKEQGYIKVIALGPHTSFTTVAAVDAWKSNPDFHSYGPRQKVARKRKKQYTEASPSGEPTSD